MMILFLILSLGGLWSVWTWVSWYLQGSGNRYRVQAMRKAKEEQEEENACRWIKAFHDAAVQRSTR